ncbi:MAG: hypothetical protein K0M45_10470 [Candidatus Paracaedibacteraceae bacterium]|nr:hypothetical protein [Candidatus Paracaedibacteraceae bacterium]
MVFKLLESAGKKWSRLRGQHRVAEVIRSPQFIDGIAQPLEQGSIAA